MAEEEKNKDKRKLPLFPPIRLHGNQGKNTNQGTLTHLFSK
jgi:hypothetical protein